MTNQHPITPPPELVDKWHDQWLNAWVSARNIRANQWIADQSAQWGADQELEACCDHLRDYQWGFIDRPDGTKMHKAVALELERRPKPPSLKEQAKAELDRLVALIPTEGALAMAEPIRRALESLPD